MCAHRSAGLRRVPHAAYDFGHGKNIVNVTLVDIRAWDTLGEVSVLVVAATGIAQPRLRPHAQRPPVARHAPRTSRRPSRNEARCSHGGRTLRPGGGPSSSTSRPLRLPRVLAASLWLLFAGHNQPGGGFVGGLVAGLALVVRYWPAASTRSTGPPVRPGLVLGSACWSRSGRRSPRSPWEAVLQVAAVDLDVPVWARSTW